MKIKPHHFYINFTFHADTFYFTMSLDFPSIHIRKIRYLLVGVTMMCNKSKK